MPKYLFYGTLTGEGLKGVIKEGGTSRGKAVGKRQCAARWPGHLCQGHLCQGHLRQGHLRQVDPPSEPTIGSIMSGGNAAREQRVAGQRGKG